MNLLLILIILINGHVFAESPSAIEQFDELRARHAGLIATDRFQARLTDASTKKILPSNLKPLKGKHIEVIVDYFIERGVRLNILNVEPFYEDALDSYAVYINTMFLPLLSSSGYRRFSDYFVVKKLQSQIFQLDFQKGDIPVRYLFETGSLGLVERIVYSEKGKKMFSLHITWHKILMSYVPVQFKTVSYEGGSSIASFALQDVKIK